MILGKNLKNRYAREMAARRDTESALEPEDLHPAMRGSTLNGAGALLRGRSRKVISEAEAPGSTGQEDLPKTHRDRVPSVFGEKLALAAVALRLD
jgi:hypothetical protein